MGAFHAAFGAMPAAGDVQLAVPVNHTVGTLVLPDPEDVVLGIGYGADGTEFVGTFAGGGGLIEVPDYVTPAVVVAQRMINIGVLSLSVAADWPVFIGSAPAAGDDGVPNSLVVISDTTGNMDGRLMSGKKVSHAGIQARIRTDDYAAGGAKARQLADAWDDTKTRPVIAFADSSYRIDNISRTTDPVYAGRDADSGLMYFAVNARVTITPVES